MHVLVPVDESDRSEDAIDFACQNYPDARITALHVLDPGDFYSATGLEGGALASYDAIKEQQERQSETVLNHARDRADEHGVEIETDQIIGGVSRSIVTYADEHDIDHIVIGSHGRTGASRILLGSVAEAVVRRSPVPVTIVR